MAPTKPKSKPPAREKKGPAGKVEKPYKAKNKPPGSEKEWKGFFKKWTLVFEIFKKEGERMTEELKESLSECWMIWAEIEILVRFHHVVYLCLHADAASHLVRRRSRH